MEYQRAHIYELQEQIRKNIALELHDSVGQSLSSIKYYVEAIIRSGEVAPESNLETRLKDVIKMIQTTADEVRRISLELRPKMLDDLGLRATIEWLLKEFQKVHPDLVIIGDIEIDEMKINEDLKVTIYRILQECLNNIAKHSSATELFVNLNLKNHAIELYVQDNGKGFEKIRNDRTLFFNGFGLSGIKERAELSGGEAAFDSTEGGGASVRVTWHEK